MPVDVAVVGAGIAGLAAAYELRRRGLSFVVLERDTRPGGVILSEEIDGFTVDGGPDALLVQKRAGIALCEELGLGGRLVVTRQPRVAYVQRAGRLHPLPAGSVMGIPTEVGPFVRSRLFTWAGKMRMGAELTIPPRRSDADESIGAFITRRFGREAATYLAEPLLAGIHAGDVDRLSMKALFPRLVEAEKKYGSLLRAFRTANREPRSPDAEGAFKSLPGGLGEMVRALVRALGVENVCTGNAVTSVTGSEPFAVRTSRNTIGARAVILAVPAFAAAALLHDRDPRLAALCSEIRYASAATVALAFRRDAVSHPLNGSGFVVPRVENTGILATTWLSSKWPHRAPDDDHVLMRAFVGGARDPNALEGSDQQLVQRALTELGPLLGIRSAPLFTRVYRWERANAQHEVGHLDRMAAIDAGLARHPGLFITGSGFRGVGVPDCVADGRATAARVAEWLGAATTTHLREVAP
jgi:oxygen-dependent protoporphyrinogen oxidase